MGSTRIWSRKSIILKSSSIGGRYWHLLSFFSGGTISATFLIILVAMHTLTVKSDRESLPPSNSRHFSSRSPRLARNSSLMQSCFLDPRETVLHWGWSSSSSSSSSVSPLSLFRFDSDVLDILDVTWTTALVCGCSLSLASSEIIWESWECVRDA